MCRLQRVTALGQTHAPVTALVTLTGAQLVLACLMGQQDDSRWP